MTLRRFSSLVLCAVLAACVHAKHVSEQTAAAPGATQANPKLEAQASDEGDHSTPPKDRPVHARQKPNANGAEPEHPPLATNPAELRKPGGEQQIVKALKQQGYLDQDDDGHDPATLAIGIREFQKSQELPATGFADAETLRLLGLDPTEINKAESPRNGTTAAQKKKADATSKSP